MFRTHGRSANGLRALCATALAAAALAAAGAGPASADATVYRGGPGLTGVYPDNLTTPLSLDWRYTSTYFGYNPSSPIIAGDTAYFASGNRIYAVDTASGGLRWRYPQDAPMSTSIGGSLAYSDGTVFIGAGDGKLYSIDAATGKPGWSFDTRSSIDGSPMVVDGTVYFGTADDRVWAVDAKTGAAVNTWRNGVKFLDEMSGAPAVGNGFVYALTSDNVLHAINIASGLERYFYRFNGNVAGMAPVVQGDFVYVANGSNLTTLMGRNLGLKWNRILSSDIATSPAVTDDAIYVITTDDRILAFEPRFGRDKWPAKSVPKLPYDAIAPPTIAGHTLIVGTTLGGVYAYDTDTGALKWSYMVAPSSTSDTVIAQHTNVAAAPVVANNTLYILTDDGSLSAFRADAVDTLGPVISDTQPDMGVVMNGSPPIEFAAKIVDDGSGVNPDSVKLLLDNQGIPRKPKTNNDTDTLDTVNGYAYDTDTAMLRYTTQEPSSASTVRPLADGRHTVTVVAADWRGNTSTKSWSFTVDNTLAKLVRRRNDNTGPGGYGKGPGRGGFPGGSGGPGGPGGPGRE